MTNIQIFGLIYFVSYILCLLIAKHMNSSIDMDGGKESPIIISIIPILNTGFCLIYIGFMIINFHIEFMKRFLFKEKDNER